MDFHRNPHSATSLTPPRVDAANVLNCLNFFPGENAQISIFPHCSYVQGSRVSNLRAIGEVAAEKVRLKVARQKRERLAESAVHIPLTLPLPRARFYLQSTLLHRSLTSAPQLASPTRHATARTSVQVGGQVSRRAETLSIIILRPRGAAQRFWCL